MGNLGRDFSLLGKLILFACLLIGAGIPQLGYCHNVVVEQDFDLLAQFNWHVVVYTLLVTFIMLSIPMGYYMHRSVMSLIKRIRYRAPLSSTDNVVIPVEPVVSQELPLVEAQQPNAEQYTSELDTSGDGDKHQQLLKMADQLHQSNEDLMRFSQQQGTGMIAIVNGLKAVQSELAQSHGSSQQLEMWLAMLNTASTQLVQLQPLLFKAHQISTDYSDQRDSLAHQPKDTPL